MAAHGTRSILHTVRGRVRVNSQAFVAWAMRRRPDQVAKLVRALVVLNLA